MLRRALWPIVLAVASPAGAQIATLPLPGVEAGIVVKPGTQSEPALSWPSGSFTAYTDYARSPSEVWYCRLEGLQCAPVRAPPSTASQHQPALAADVLFYVDDAVNGGNVIRLSLTQGYLGPVAPFPARQSRPAASDQVVAWEDQRDLANGVDIRVHHVLLGGDWSITGPGVQRMPRVSGTRVSYIDDAVGGVKVYDLATGDTTTAYPAAAYYADIDGTAVVVENSLADLEVRTLDGRQLASLVLPGLQSNPRISGDWVAFEDNSTLVSRVIVWNWKTGDLFAPPAGTSSQTLNDVSWPRVVYVDDRNKDTNPDIFLFDTSATADGGPDGGTDGGDGGPDGGQPARCDDATAAPLATLQVLREGGGPDARSTVFTAEAEIPVLVCIHAEDVSAAWVLLDHEAVARPSNFNQQVVHLESRHSVAAGPNCLSALIAGKPGSWLEVRLLPDPAGGPARLAGASLRAPAEESPAGAGCSAGGAGLLAALPLAAWLWRRRPRRP